jgi:DNA adenine methylase
MVELDDDIASVWETIFSANNKTLADLITTFQMNTENVFHQLSVPPDGRIKQAFLTILRNRVSHGGIMANGSGLIKSGENGKGIGSRWYPRTLSRRIRDIDVVADKIEFVQTDGLAEIERFAGYNDVVFFVDPPYTAGGKKAGKRLYKHNELDHERLFKELSAVKGDFLMTYDYSQEIFDLAVHENFDVEPVAMTNTHHARMNELLVGRDLSWVRRY